MRRFALAIAIAPLVALAVAPALACKPAPPRPIESVEKAPPGPPPPTTVRTDPAPAPTPPSPPPVEVDPGFADEPPHLPYLPEPVRPPVNPWSDSDTARFDRLIDLMAAAVETLEPHKDSVQDAKAALLKAIALHKTTVAGIMAEGQALAERMQEQPEGFQEYIMSRMARIQRISNDMGRLTSTQQRALAELFDAG